MHYGKAIRLLRVSKGLSQKKVAELLSISQQAYSKIEKKRWLKLDLVERILRLLECNRFEFDLAGRISRENEKTG